MTKLWCFEVFDKQLKTSGRWAPQVATWNPSQQDDMESGFHIEDDMEKNDVIGTISSDMASTINDYIASTIDG